jgi:lysozyme
MDILEQLKRDEGLRLKPYVDTVGKITIGYGTNISDGIDKGEAEYLLSNRLNEKKLELLRALPWVADLDEARRGVLFNMAYNLGVPGLLGFKRTLTLIKETMYAEAAAAMLQSKWAAQVGERAKRLSKQMETGQWI